MWLGYCYDGASETTSKVLCIVAGPIGDIYKTCLFTQVFLVPRYSGDAPKVTKLQELHFK